MIIYIYVLFRSYYINIQARNKIRERSKHILVRESSGFSNGIKSSNVPMHAFQHQWRSHNSSLTLTCHLPSAAAAAPSLLVDWVDMSEHLGCNEILPPLQRSNEHSCFYVQVVVVEHAGCVARLEVIGIKLNLILLPPLQRKTEHYYFYR